MNKLQKGKSACKSNKNKKQEVCRHCSKPGHTEENCWELHPEKKREFEKKQKDKSSASKKSSANYTLYTTGLASVATKTSWLVDMGASNHITHDRDAFTDYTTENLCQVETLAGNVTPMGRGTVVITGECTNGSIVTLRLKDVFYIPDIPFNLFSGTSIRKHSFYVYGKTDTIRKTDNDEEVVAMNIVNRALIL